MLANTLVPPLLNASQFAPSAGQSSKAGEETAALFLRLSEEKHEVDALLLEHRNTYGDIQKVGALSVAH